THAFTGERLGRGAIDALLVASRRALRFRTAHEQTLAVGKPLGRSVPLDRAGLKVDRLTSADRIQHDLWRRRDDRQRPAPVRREFLRIAFAESDGSRSVGLSQHHSVVLAPARSDIAQQQPLPVARQTAGAGVEPRKVAFAVLPRYSRTHIRK